MEFKFPSGRAARRLAGNRARETGTGEPKLTESALDGNEFEGHVQGILNCFAPHHRSMLDQIELAPIECPQCRRILITGSVKGLPQTFHGCRCLLVVHLMPGPSIPRHAGDWAAHLLAQAADYAKE